MSSPCINNADSDTALLHYAHIWADLSEAVVAHMNEVAWRTFYQWLKSFSSFDLTKLLHD